MHTSAFARLHDADLYAFHFKGGFWAPWLEALHNQTLPGQFRSMETTGRLDNFRRAAGLIERDHQGYVFNDSDVYKWLEAAARAGCRGEEYETVVKLVLAAQGPDGYLNTAFMFEKTVERWTNIRDQHELYCAGHFIEAALAMKAAGDERLFAAACRSADLICSLFGPAESGRRPVVPGHEEIEIALIGLYRVTGEARYLEQARYFVDARGQKLIGGLPYHQDHKPFRELEKMTGHAVRALYLNIAAADLYLETGDAGLLATLERLWERLYTRQIYVTGGLGARHSGEAFGEDYELPNAGAYSETCASVASILWNRRMLQITGDSRYADAIETTLFNAALAGISLAGDAYFYTNPLASEGQHRRAAYFNCACCPPNIARLLASLGADIVSAGAGSVWLHQYAAGEATVDLDGREFRFRVETDYPWSGLVTVTVLTAGRCSLRLRVPGWAARAAVFLNNAALAEPGPGYVALERIWEAGDRVELQLPVAPRWVESHPAVLENAGRAALAVGPLVYCVESADPHPENLRIDIDRAPERVEEGGLVRYRLHAIKVPSDPAWDHALYRPAGGPSAGGEPASVQAIPYFAWANGEPRPMRVWLRRDAES